MTSETDTEFLDSMEQWVIGSLVFKREHRERLFTLARRGAEMQWRPIEEEYEGEVLLWPRGSAVPSHFMPLPPPPAEETNE